jgi:hypothetical protein
VNGAETAPGEVVSTLIADPAGKFGSAADIKAFVWVFIFVPRPCVEKTSETGALAPGAEEEPPAGEELSLFPHPLKTIAAHATTINNVPSDFLIYAFLLILTNNSLIRFG